MVVFDHFPLLPIESHRVNQPTVWDKDLPPLRLFGMCLLDPVLPHTDVQKVRSKTKQEANEPLAVTALAVPHPDSRCPPTANPTASAPPHLGRYSGCHRPTAGNLSPAFSSIRTHTYCPSKEATLPKVMHIQGLY